MNETSPLKLSETSSKGTFKRIIFSIIVALEFKNEFVTKYSPETLKQDLIAFNKKLVKKQSGMKQPRGKGGTDFVRKLPSNKINADLIKCLNDIGIVPFAESCKTLAKCFDEKVIDSQWIETLNHFAPCQYLITKKFYSINEYKIKIGKERYNPILIEESFYEDLIINSFEIELIGGRKYGNLNSEDDSGSQIENCIGYYLIDNNSFEYQKLLKAYVILTWKGEELEKLTLKQNKNIKEGDGLIFQSIHIHHSHNEGSIYILLEGKSDRSKLFNQNIIIEKKENNGVRWGTYSSTYSFYKEKKLIIIPITGIIALQTISAEASAKLENKDIDTIDKKELDKKMSDFQKTEVFLQYSIRKKLVSISTRLYEQNSINWDLLEKFTGRYICYYIRLSKRRYENSRIEIFPDGAATLRQHQEKEITHGYVKVDDGKLWLFFGRKIDSDIEPIRFVVEPPISNTANNTIFKGIYSSETLGTRQLVSGRMLMARIPDENNWPEFISVDYDKTTYRDFEIEGEIDIKVKEILEFFTDEKHNDFMLTDGPIWNSISQRLLRHPALGHIENMFRKPKDSDARLISLGKFYYYTFKKDASDDGPYFIERNTLTFKRNGKVEVQASSILYEGHAYHLHKTLRLSLSNSENGGFLEVFLDLNENLTNFSSIKILYGISLWNNGKRIQGKAVVLSRLEGDLLNDNTEFFRLLDPEDEDFKNENNRIEDEDSRGGGVMSYLRGQKNRYMHTTAQASHERFRPRDKTSRETHFLCACFYGYEINTKNLDKSNISNLIENTKDHLRQAFEHGFALAFAGIAIDIESAPKIFNFVEKKYLEKFPGSKINETKTLDIIRRIKEINQEQIMLKDSISENGPLSHPDLVSYVKLIWNNLLSEKPSIKSSANP